MFPIPLALLGDSCVLKKYSRSIAGRELISETTLTNVRICTSRYWKSDGKTDKLCKAGMLYFDAVNSYPEDVEFIGEGYVSEVVFENERYAVRSAEIFCDSEGLHHFEVHLEMM